ncbi:MAG TPA: CoA transferase, partial [Casimicrobiaceae bacterium]|nr:CoA transferase [Casimicrobiaceae bacterium]
ECIAREHPHLVHVSVTPFGHTGPRARWRASDLELMAAGGAMSLAGEPHGKPLRISVPQARAWAGTQAASGALVALFHRQMTGRGQHVDVSAQAAILVALAHAPAFVDMVDEVPTRCGAFITGRTITGARLRAFWRCRDGYINFVIYGGNAGRRSNEQLIAWMREARAELGPLAALDAACFDPKRLTQAEIDALEAPVAVFFASLTKREFLEGASAREMLGYPVSSVADIAADPQLDAREFWDDIAAANGEILRHCGAFARIDGARPKLRYAAGTPVSLRALVATWAPRTSQSRPTPAMAPEEVSS